MRAHAHMTQLGVRVKHSVPSRCSFLSAVLLRRPLSFPPGQATHSTPSAPEDLGSLPDWDPGRPSRQAAESALPSGGSSGKALRSFSREFGNVVFLSFSELDLPSCSGQRGFIFFLNPTCHWKAPQLSFSRAPKVLVLC